MKFIELAFRLGVVFAIFGFIWGIFQIALTILRGIRPKTLFEQYALKFLQYIFLVDVTFLFCLQKGDYLLNYELTITGLVLLMYFVGKLQNNQSKMQWFQISAMQMPALKPLFNFTAEIAIISTALILFVTFIFFPEFAQNPISNWFYESILSIEKTPIFGIFFKIIGFFVLVNLLSKMLNGITFLLSGKPFISVKKEINIETGTKRKDDFDDFEEVN